jgi:hypothetical protein
MSVRTGLAGFVIQLPKMTCLNLISPALRRLHCNCAGQIASSFCNTRHRQHVPAGIRLVLPKYRLHAKLTVAANWLPWPAASSKSKQVNLLLAVATPLR